MTERAIVIDGVAAADELIARISQHVAQFKRASGITPGLAIVALEGDSVQGFYVRKKIVQCGRAGIGALIKVFSASVTTEELERLVQGLNADPSVHGIFVQWPLPDHVDPGAVAKAIAPLKDIDGMGSDCYVPAAALACRSLIGSVLSGMAGLQAAVAGDSGVFTKAIARILLDAKCGVTLATRGNDDLIAICRRADILIAAVGEPELIRGGWIKPGAVVVDVGINVIAGYDGRRRYVGAVKFEEALRVARAITPVPGGVGPMTIACLLENTLAAAQRHTRGGWMGHGRH